MHMLIVEGIMKKRVSEVNQIKKSKVRQVDLDNQAMSLKDENNDIYNFERNIAKWMADEEDSVE